MTSTLTASLVKQALGQISDFSTALQAKLLNVPADEQVAEDILADIAMADPALAPAAALAGALIPAVVAAAAFIAANNQAAQPGGELGPWAGGDESTDPARGR